jgi:hypothetical protein
MTNNPPSGYHLNNLWVLSCQQQIIALSKVCNVNNTIILEQKIVVFSLVATTNLLELQASTWPKHLLATESMQDHK